MEVRILQRYFRKTKAHPDGGVVHHGDCDFFSIRICTCGLHHDLRPAIAEFVAERYPLLHEELAEYEAARSLLLRRESAPRKK